MGKKAALYARYSSDLQNPRSIDDQLALCRDFAAKNELAVVATYTDQAQSGASMLGRDGLSAMMEEAAKGAFEVAVVESLDRLSRDQGDISSIYNRLSFHGVDIELAHGGRADPLQVGVQGILNAVYFKDLREKTRRGLSGRVRAGLSAGGRSYGYKPVPGKPGELEIVPEEAEIVRRILSEYVAGKSPREIAGDLNRDGVPPPRGARWNASTINGNCQRGSGIIFKELYRGRLIWNKVRMDRNPETGRRVSRPNPPEEWQRVNVPHLRIVDDTLWDQVHEVKAQRAKLSSAHKRRPSHLLSGLLQCGVCGSGMSVHDRDKKRHRIRVRCSAVRESGTCSNRHSFYTDKIEEAVILALTEQLQDTGYIEHYLQTYNREQARLRRHSSRKRLQIERKLTAIEINVSKLVDAITEGIIDKADARLKRQDLRDQKAALEAELAVTEAPPTIVSLHPTTVAHYLRSVTGLREALHDHVLAGDDRISVAKDLRTLVDSVVVTPEHGGSEFRIEVRGKLSILTDSTHLQLGEKVVAGEGLEPPVPSSL